MIASACTHLVRLRIITNSGKLHYLFGMVFLTKYVIKQFWNINYCEGNY